MNTQKSIVKNANEIIGAVNNIKKAVIEASEQAVIITFGKSIIVINIADGEVCKMNRETPGIMYTMSLDNAKRRAIKLYDRIMSDNNPEYFKYASDIKSILTYNLEAVEVDVYSYEQVRAGRSWLNTQLSEVKFARTVMITRRSAPFMEHDMKLVKIVDKTELDNYDATKDLEDNDNEDDIYDKDIKGFKIRLDEALLLNVQEQVVDALEINGYHLIGGNSDRGLLLFSKEEMGISAEKSVKLARMMMSGGLKLRYERPLKMRLIDFSVASPDRRDGLIMIVKTKVFRQISKYNDILGDSWQTRIIVMKEAAMKGMVYHSDSRLAVMFDSRFDDSIDGLIDLNEYRKIFGKGCNDQIIELEAGNIWVMESDERVELKEIHLSHQMVDRAPVAIQRIVAQKNMDKLNELLEAAKSDDKRSILPYLSSYGYFGKMKEAGIKPFYKKDPKTEEYHVDSRYETALFQRVIIGNAKGWTEPGYYIRVFHDDSLSIDTGSQIPGISVPKKMKVFENGQKREVKVGDLLVIARYPLLRAKDNEGRSPYCFVARVERITDRRVVSLNSQTLLYMLGDEDGDKLTITLLEQSLYRSNPDLLKCGQGFVYATSLYPEGQVPANNKQKKDPMAKLGLNPVLLIVANQSSNIGYADNVNTSAQKYIEAHYTQHGLEVPKAPSGENEDVYATKSEQSEIDVKKHADRVNPIYIFMNLLKYYEEIIPEAFEMDDNGKARFVKQGELNVRKLKDENGNFIPSNKATLQDLQRAIDELPEVYTSPSMELYRKAATFKLTPDGFAEYDEYYHAGRQINNMVKRLVSADKHKGFYLSIEKLMQEAKLFRKEVAQGVFVTDMDAATKYIEKAALGIKANCSKAYWILAQASFVIASRNTYGVNTSVQSPYWWISFCDVDFLKKLVYISEGKVKVSLELFGLSEEEETGVFSVETLDQYRIAVSTKGKDMPSPDFKPGQEVIVIGNTIDDYQIQGKGEFPEEAIYVVICQEPYVKMDGSVSDRRANLIIRKA